MGRKKQGIPLPECPVVEVSYCVLARPRGAAGLLLVAVGEFRRSDLGAPVEALRNLVEFLGVPEGAVVSRINPHGAVVAPAV